MSLFSSARVATTGAENVRKRLRNFRSASSSRSGSNICSGCGDSLNPPADAVRRGKIGWIGVRHQESAALAAAGQAKLSGQLAVCAGTTGSTHLISLPATALLASRLCVLSPTRRIPLRSSRSIEAPVPDQAAVVRDPVTLDDDPPYFSVYQKGPVLIDRQSETHQYALVMRKIVGMLRTSAFLQICRGGAHNAPVIGEALDPQRAIRQLRQARRSRTSRCGGSAGDRT